MKILEHEKLDPLWIKIKAELERRLQELREENDSPMGALDHAKTMWLRGQISEVKRVLEWDAEPLNINDGRL